MTRIVSTLIVILASVAPVLAQVQDQDLFRRNGLFSGSLTVSGTVCIGSTPDVCAARDAAAVLALKNGATAQTLRVYGTTSGGKYIAIAHDATNGVITTSTGKVLFSSAGHVVGPSANWTDDLGEDGTRWKNLFAAELSVWQLIARSVTSTIGGELWTAPTTTASADLSSGGTTLTAKDNEIAADDHLLMSSMGRVEMVRATAGPGGSAGAYTYTVARDEDGTGANAWPAGSAIVNTGTTGDGMIAQYADTSALSALIGSTLQGPTIAGIVRTGTAWNALAPRWALGCLKGLYGYAGCSWGIGVGNPSGAHITVTDTDGVSAFDSNGVARLVMDTSGNATFSGTLTVGSGRNLLQDSTFAGGVVDGVDQAHAWASSSDGDDGVTWAIGRDLVGYFPTGGHAAYLHGGADMPANSWRRIWGPLIPVVAGARYEYSFYAGNHRISGGVRPYVIWYDASDGYVGESAGDSLVAVTTSSAGGTSLSGWGRGSAFFTAPSGTALARLAIWMQCNAGATCADPYAFITRLYFGEAGVGQTTPTPWGPGGVTLITGTSIASRSLSGTELAVTANITAGTGNNVARLSGDDATYRIWAGHATAASAPFRVGQDGSLVATSATITGDITATSGSFSGSITSGSGAIGGWTLGSTSLVAGTGADTVGLDSGGSNPAIYAGSDTPGAAPFRVTKAGALTATNATIVGTVSNGDVTLDGSGVLLDNNSTRVSFGNFGQVYGASGTGSVAVQATGPIFLIPGAAGVYANGHLYLNGGHLIPATGAEEIGTSSAPMHYLWTSAATVTGLAGVGNQAFVCVGLSGELFASSGTCDGSGPSASLHAAPETDLAALRAELAALRAEVARMHDALATLNRQ